MLPSADSPALLSEERLIFFGQPSRPRQRLTQPDVSRETSNPVMGGKRRAQSRPTLPPPTQHASLNRFPLSHSGCGVVDTRPTLRETMSRWSFPRGPRTVPRLRREAGPDPITDGPKRASSAPRRCCPADVLPNCPWPLPPERTVRVRGAWPATGVCVDGRNGWNFIPRAGERTRAR
mgnify:CR=1 FL=1